MISMVLALKRADDMAKIFGIKTDDQRRIEAAILFGIKTYSFSRGDTYILDQQLKLAALQILEDDVSEEKIFAGINIIN